MKANLALIILTSLLALTVTSQTSGQTAQQDDALNPIDAAAEYPLLLRRTTLIVRDIETSLKLYRDGL
ncbi:MAG: hypothetical protein VW104_02450, partial [Halieaceae bacterium]